MSWFQWFFRRYFFVCLEVGFHIYCLEQVEREQENNHCDSPLIGLWIELKPLWLETVEVESIPLGHNQYSCKQYS